MRIGIPLALWMMIAACLAPACGAARPTSAMLGTAAGPMIEGTSSAAGRLPTPDPETGVVTGRAISSTTGTALAAQGIYLGERLMLTPGPGYLLTLQQESSPHTTTDEAGGFTLLGVPPGEYALILWTPFKSRVALDSSGLVELRVVVQAGRVTDLGSIEVDWP